MAALGSPKGCHLGRARDGVSGSALCVHDSQLTESGVRRAWSLLVCSSLSWGSRQAHLGELSKDAWVEAQQVGRRDVLGQHVWFCSKFGLRIPY